MKNQDKMAVAIATAWFALMCMAIGWLDPLQTYPAPAGAVKLVFLVLCLVAIPSAALLIAVKYFPSKQSADADRAALPLN